MTLHIPLGGNEATHHSTSVDVEAPTVSSMDPKYLGSVADKHDMKSLGRVQILLRNFRFISILAFACTLVSTWERILTLLLIPLTNGGTAGLIWGFLGVSVGFSFVYASISEMASIAPTSGGQYHWVSEFAPRRCQKFLSYITGWLTTTGWHCNNVTVAYLTAFTIQGLLALEKPTYVPRPWHCTLLIIAICTFGTIVSTCLRKRLPTLEGIILILHLVGLFIVAIPLWVLAPRNTRNAFFEFNAGGGWNNPGLATLVGLSASVISMMGHDGAVHMAEEIADASLTLPRAIMSAMGLNAVLGLIIVITICCTLGDLQTVLEGNTQLPFIQIIYNATADHALTRALLCIVIVSIKASVTTGIATSSRQLWSFSRDQGVPFSSVFAYVSPRWNIPLNAMIASQVIITLLSLVNIISHQALNVITTISNTAGISSLILSIGCLLLKRLRGESLPPRRWSLGRFGLLCNVMGLAFLISVFVFTFLSWGPNPGLDINWGAVMYAGVVAFASVYYYFRGRYNFIAPVALVKREVVASLELRHSQN